MNSDAVIMFALALTGGTLCLSLMVGWATLKRPSHALLWAAAFGLGSAQWGLMGQRAATGGESPTAIFFSCVLGTWFSLLLSAGFAIRAGRPIRPTSLALIALGCAAVIGCALVGGEANLARALPHLSRGLLLICAARIACKNLRRMAYTEAFATSVLVIFAAFSFVVGTLRLAGTSDAGELAHLMVLVGLPVAFTNLGAATLLLLASDLGRELENLAVTDPLTGVLNRRGFELAVAAARHRPGGAAVLVIDVDGFKAVNDTYGHAVGDDVLTAVAACLAESMRGYDVVGRLGGDEFAVLLTGASEATAKATATRIRSLLESRTVHAPGVRLPTVSIGIAPLTLGQAALGQALSKADQALYRCKVARHANEAPRSPSKPRLALVGAPR